MMAFRTLTALSLAALATACATPHNMNAGSASPGMGHAAGTPMPMAAKDARMVAMKDMHQKMMNARTPAERQAMMAEHMKTMQDGMAMMQASHNRHATHGKQGMTGMTSMGDGSAMQAEMAKREQMMAEHTAMMQMMMDMMKQRMPAGAP